MQDFLNGVCTHIIWLTKQKLTYYTGNYDTFCKTVRENEVIQQKKYEKEQDDIKHLKAFISSCGKHLTLSGLNSSCHVHSLCTAPKFRSRLGHGTALRMRITLRTFEQQTFSARPAWYIMLCLVQSTRASWKILVILPA